MRKAFSDTLCAVAAQDPKLIFLTGDLGFQVFDEFIARFPQRYLNVGVAEAQLINAAVGLALEGWRPIAYSIASFATARAFEQIRFGISYHNLPVLIVGAGGGFTYAKAGVTHHAPDDLTLMATLPGMQIVSPGGPDELRELMPQLLKSDSPSYLRVGKFGEPEINHPSPIMVGKARQLLDGSNIAIITSGDIAPTVLQAIRGFAGNGISPSLYHFHTIKPIDTACFSAIAETHATALVIEESIPQGGIYHEICAWKAEANSPLRVVRIGAPDKFMFGNPEREELRTSLGIDQEQLHARLSALCGAQP